MLRSRGYITISNASYKVQTDTSGLVYPSQKEGREKRKKRRQEEQGFEEQLVSKLGNTVTSGWT